MVEVTQEDREAADRYFTSKEPLAEALARHRIAAFNAGLEAAAKVADEVSMDCAGLREGVYFARLSNNIRELKIGEE